MSPAANGKKVRLQATLSPETWERYNAEAERLGIDVSALLEVIATLLPLRVDLRNSHGRTSR